LPTAYFTLKLNIGGKMKKGFLILSILFIMAAGYGCASVKPWEKDILADQIMIFDHDKTETAAREHTMNSLEGSWGGFGVGGGGCGCN